MISCSQRVKDALLDGTYLKNYRIEYTANDVDYEIIDNSHLVSESVKFDERLCSSDDLKFGLCEGSSVEFETDTKLKKGYNLIIYLEAQYKASDGTLDYEDILMGHYVVDNVSMHQETGIYKVIAYDKLQSGNLDNVVNYYAIAASNKTELGYATLGGIIDFSSYFFGIYPNSTQYSLCTSIKANSNTPTYDVVETLTTKDSKTIQICKMTTSYDLELSWDGTVPRKTYAYRINSKPDSYLDDIKTVYEKYYGDLTLVIDDEEISFSDWYDSIESTYIKVLLPTIGGDFEVYGGNRGKKLETRFRKVTDDDIYYTYGNIQYIIYCPDIDETVADLIYRIGIKCYNDKTQPMAQRIYTDIEKTTVTQAQVKAWDDVTLRQMFSAVHEIYGAFGKLKRGDDIIYPVYLGNDDNLYPADGVYPSDFYKPRADSEHANESIYRKLYTGDFDICKIGLLTLHYKKETTDDDGNTTSEDATISLRINDWRPSSYYVVVDYEISDNWFFNTFVLTEAQATTYANSFKSAVQDLEWVRFELDCVGMPYLEVGDPIELIKRHATYDEKGYLVQNGITCKTYVLNRQMSGIQNLQDTISNGNVNTY